MACDVLIVEDDIDIRDDLAFLLKDEGYSVATAQHGAVALEYLRRTSPPRVILLDLMMPVMDGWRLREELLRDASFARIPVVVLSGAGAPRPDVAAMGAAAYVTKPFNVQALLSIVAKLSRGSHVDLKRH